jgi:hypothetical protein
LVRKHQYERMFDDQVGWEDNSNTDSREIQWGTGLDSTG